MAYSLKQLNDAIRSDPAAYAAECDAAFAKKVEAAARKIADHRGQSHIILLSGPSGSGKTTTAMKIGDCDAYHLHGQLFQHSGPGDRTPEPGGSH